MRLPDYEVQELDKSKAILVKASELMEYDEYKCLVTNLQKILGHDNFMIVPQDMDFIQLDRDALVTLRDTIQHILDISDKGCK